jgi:hypothetical protein
MCLQCNLDLPLPLTPLLRTILAGFILLFSYMDTKYIHHIHPYSPFSCVHPPLTGIHPWERSIFPYCPSFFKCILIVQAGFVFVLQACVYGVLIKLTPTPRYLLIPYHCAPLIFNSLPYSALHYIHI